MIYVKGAPLEMLQQCDRFYWNDEVRPLTAPDRQRILEENDAMASAACACSRSPTATARNLNGAPFTISGHRDALGLSRLGSTIRSGASRSSGGDPRLPHRRHPRHHDHRRLRAHRRQHRPANRPRTESVALRSFTGVRSFRVRRSTVAPYPGQRRNDLRPRRTGA